MIAGALFFYQFHSWKNRLLLRIKRLRQPKYLFGAIVGGLYVYWYFFRPFLTDKGLKMSVLPAEYHDLAEMIGAVLLMGVVLLIWIIPHQRASIAFTEAEIAFLFPAPVSRRTLIHFKLLKSQAGILFLAFVFALLGRSLGGGLLIRVIGWWVLMSIVNLHMLGSSFAMTRLMDRGISSGKRRFFILGTVGVLISGFIYWYWSVIPSPKETDFSANGALVNYLRQLLGSGPLPWVLFPFRLVVAPYLTPTLGKCFLALMPALILMVLHYIWVIRSNVAFEEASVDAARKIAERLAAVKSGNWQALQVPKKVKREPFVLRPWGQPAVALLWKNLISAGGIFSARSLFLIGYFVVMGGFLCASLIRHGGIGLMFVAFLAFLLMMSLFLGPQMLRQDFRQDLLCADILKGYPIPGWQVALGELSAPVAILSGVQWLLILLAVIFCPASLSQHEISVPMRLSVGFGAALLLPLIDFITISIPNAAVLIFPAWFQLGKDAAHGIEVMGQRLILMFGQLFVVILSLVPAAALFAGVYFILSGLLGSVPTIVISSLAAAALLLGEAWLITKGLGKRFEQFDLSAELNG